GGDVGTLGNHPRPEGETMRALRMAGDLRFFPGPEIGVESLERARRFGFQAGDLLANRDGVAGVRERPQFLDFGLQLGHPFFEIEISAHRSDTSKLMIRVRFLDLTIRRCDRVPRACVSLVHCGSASGWRSRTRLLSRSSSTWV